MNDRITVVVYNANDEAISTEFEDSVKAYLLRNWSGWADTLKIVAADALNYGAEAQKNFNYNQENLANAEMPAELAALATQDVELNYERYMSANGMGTSVGLTSNMQFAAYFKNIKDAEVENMYAEVSFTNYQGVKKTARVEGKEFTKAASGMYGVLVTSTVIADVRCEITVVMYNADGSEHGRSVDSVEGYAMRQPMDLTKAIMKFGDSARAHFTK